MAGHIPETKFRLEHGFAIKPDLVLDKGPGKSLVIGQNVPANALEAIYLGKQAETPYADIWLDVRGAHVLYVMGKRRSGKSYTLGVVAEGLAAQTWVRQGTLQQGVVILDSMNVFLTMPYVVERALSAGDATLQELRKWRLEPEEIPVTLFRPRGTSTPAALTSVEITLRPSDLGPEEWCGLFEADPFADPLGHLITEIYAKTAVDGYTDSASGQQVLPNPTFSLGDLIGTLEHDSDMPRYHRDTRESMRRRLDAVRRLPIFSDAGLDIRQLIQPGCISILLLRDIDQVLRVVLVALVVKRMMQLRAISEQEERMIPIHIARANLLGPRDTEAAARERQLADECVQKTKKGIPRSWLIIDEAHNYVPAHVAVASRIPLKKYVDEGRNLGLSIVVATQQPSGLDPSIQRNADMILIHALSHHDDIQAAEGMINTAIPSEVTVDIHEQIQGSRAFETLIRQLPQGYALASTDRANRLFPVRLRPRMTVHGGADY